MNQPDPFNDPNIIWIDDEMQHVAVGRNPLNAEQQERLQELIRLGRVSRVNLTPPATSVADVIAESWAMSRTTRADAPQAAAEQRCATPEAGGCGKPLQGFRDDLSAREYKITGYCQSCQDRVYGLAAADGELEPAEIARLEADPDIFRCSECGEYRELTEVDVGVYDARGRSATYEVCCSTSGPRCTAVPGCFYGDGHVHHHVTVDLHKPRCWRCRGYLGETAQPRRCTCEGP